MTYEDTLGPIHPGFYEPIGLDLQNRLREIEHQRGQDKVWVTLSTLQSVYNLEEISELLQLTPDYVKRDGDTIYEGGKHHIKSAGAYWSQSSSGHVDGVALEHHLKWALQQLHGKLPAVRLLQQNGNYMTLTAHMRVFSPNVFTSLDEEMLAALAQLRVPLKFNIGYKCTS